MDGFKRMTPAEQEKYEKKKKLRTGMIISGIFFVLLMLIAMMILQSENNAFKYFINDVKVPVSSTFLIYENEKPYVAAKELAKLTGYRYHNDSYEGFSKNENGVYIQNDCEVSSMEAGTNRLVKYISATEEKRDELYFGNQEAQIFVESQILSPNGYKETTELSAPVIKKGEEFYFPLECLNDILNYKVVLEDKALKLYDLNYLTMEALRIVPSYGYTTISGDYENIRALAYGLVIVGEEENKGVISLNGDTIVSTKYSQIRFNQNVKEFMVKNSNSVGILNIEGESIIDLSKNYDDIEVFSDDLSLYLVSNIEGKGILNRKNEEVVYVNYDSIGINEDILEKFQIKKVEKEYIPFGTTIVANKNEKVEIYNVNRPGKPSSKYSGLGCVPLNLANKGEYNIKNESIKEHENAEKVLFIDLELADEKGIKAIVVQELIPELNETRYGIYDTLSGKEIIPCACTQIYGIQKKGMVKYYMEYEGEEIELVNYIEDNETIKAGLENYNKYDFEIIDEADEKAREKKEEDAKKLENVNVAK